MFRINDVEVKTPQALVVDFHTIDSDSSGRVASGKMVRDIIATKRRLMLEWGACSVSEASQILNLISQPFFSVTYLDIQANQIQTRTFYCGDRSTPWYSWNEKFKNIALEGLRVNFIEE